MIAILAPLARLFQFAVARRNRRFDRGDGVERVSAPVISVGNLTVGGTGKTPVVAALARHLAGAGARPAIVSRGYGGRAGRGPLLVSDGNGAPRVEAARCGDEPYLLAATLPGVAVWVGSDRVQGAVEATRQGATAILLDDGFQHRRLHRDLDLLLIDGERALGNGRLLPAGPLREPATSIGRADRVLITRSARAEQHNELRQLIDRHHPGVPTGRAGTRVVGFVDRNGQAVEPPNRVVAFCGIAHPERFRQSLESLGVDPVRFRSFPDHHRYSAAERNSLARQALDGEATLVTTEKDLARLPAELFEERSPRLLALRIEAEFYDDGALLQAVLRVAGGECR